MQVSAIIPFLALLTRYASAVYIDARIYWGGDCLPENEMTDMDLIVNDRRYDWQHFCQPVTDAGSLTVNVTANSQYIGTLWCIHALQPDLSAQVRLTFLPAAQDCTGWSANNIPLDGTCINSLFAALSLDCDTRYAPNLCTPWPPRDGTMSEFDAGGEEQGTSRGTLEYAVVA